MLVAAGCQGSCRFGLNSPVRRARGDGPVDIGRAGCQLVLDDAKSARQWTVSTI